MKFKFSLVQCHVGWSVAFVC